jgi:hypothetical protein
VNTADAVALVAAFELPGACADPISLDDPDGFLASAAAARVLPTVAAALAAGQIEGIDDEWRRQLRDRHMESVHITMAAHAAAAAVIERLRTGGVDDVLVLKGVATGHLDYARPFDRYSTDVDLLVRGDDLDHVLPLLPGAEAPTPRRPGWDARYGKAVTVRGESGVELDLHTSLAQGYFGLAIPPDALFAATDEFSVGGTAARALDGPNRLIHAAVHLATSQHVGLHSARDIPQLVFVSGVDWTEAAERSRAWGIDAIVARGVRAAWQRFPLERHSILDWAEAVQPVGRQRLALRLSDGPHARHYLTGPLALPVRRWPGYLVPIVWPSRAYLAEHGKTRTQRIRLLLPDLRRGRTP